MSGIKASRDITNALLEAAPDATVYVDSGGRIVLVNAQAERLFGYQREDLAGQPQVSQAEIGLRAVDLGAVAASIAKELQHDSPGRYVRFTIQQPAWALADRVLIWTVLQNLPGNAWKFTAGQADAAIEFGTMPVPDASVCCCYVRDNGAGFDSAWPP